MSSAEPAPACYQGVWVGADGSRLMIAATGKIRYNTVGMNIDGMGMSGWESYEGCVVPCKIKGNILCISQSFDLAPDPQSSSNQSDITQLMVNGAAMRKETGYGT